MSPNIVIALAPFGGAELELAFLACLVKHRPVGIHRHLVILDLQRSLYLRTRVWIELPNLWEGVKELFNLEALDRAQCPEIPLPFFPGLEASVEAIPDGQPDVPKETLASSASDPGTSIPTATQSAPATMDRIESTPIMPARQNHKVSRRHIKPTKPAAARRKLLKRPGVVTTPSLLSTNINHHPHFASAFTLPYFHLPLTPADCSPSDHSGKIARAASETVEEDLQWWSDAILARAADPTVDHGWPDWRDVGHLSAQQSAPIPAQRRLDVPPSRSGWNTTRVADALPLESNAPVPGLSGTLHQATNRGSSDEVDEAPVLRLVETNIRDESMGRGEERPAKKRKGLPLAEKAVEAERNVEGCGDIEGIDVIL